MKPTTYAAALVVAATTLYTPKAEALMVWADAHPVVPCYQVQKGDTLHGIAKKLMDGAPAGLESMMGASVESRLASWNNITAPEDLTVGNILVVPEQLRVDIYSAFPFVDKCPIKYYSRSEYVSKPIIHIFPIHER